MSAVLVMVFIRHKHQATDLDRWHVHGTGLQRGGSNQDQDNCELHADEATTATCSASGPVGMGRGSEPNCEAVATKVTPSLWRVSCNRARRDRHLESKVSAG